MTLSPKAGGVSLREHLESIIASHSVIDGLRFESNEKARALASGEMNRRLEEMNKFREQLTAQAATFMSEKEFNVRHDVLLNRVGQLENKNSNLEGRLWAIGAGVTIFNLLLTLAGLYLAAHRV